MKVKDLVIALLKENQELDVKFSYDYGDYWHSKVAKDITNITEENCHYSDYHRMDRISDSDEKNENNKIVLVLS